MKKWVRKPSKVAMAWAVVVLLVIILLVIFYPDAGLVIPEGGE